jgi:hypothetical protein
MIEVEAPDGSIVEFPVGTPSDTIKSVMSKQFGGPQSAEASTGFRVPEVVTDVAKAIPSGLARGVAGVASLPSVMEYAVGEAVGFPGRIYNRMAGDGTWAKPELMQRGKDRAAQAAGGRSMPGYNDIIDGIESVTGELYEPQTRAGKYAGTIAEFAAGAPFTASNAAKLGSRVLQRGAQLVVPAVTSETAGQLTEGTAAEPYARVAGAFAGAGGVGIAQARSGGKQLAAEALRGADPQDVQRATTLMREAKNLPGGGVTLTFDEALNQVTSGKFGKLSQLRRVAEYSGSRGAEKIGAVRAGRALEVDRAGNAAVDAIAPRPYPADRAAQATQTAADNALRDLTKRRTQAVNPLYERAKNDIVPEQDMARVFDDLIDIVGNAPVPETTKGANRLGQLMIAKQATPATPTRTVPVIDPQTGMSYGNRVIPGSPATPAIPERNVGRLDKVYQAVRDTYTGDLPITATSLDKAVQRETQKALNSLDSALRQASPDLARGRDLYGRITDRIVTPAQQGPLGRIAASDPGGANASATMGRTLAGAGESNRYHTVIGQATRRLVRQDPRAAETAARDYIADVFMRNTRDLQGGPNPYGGANFRAILVGNAADEANLRALVSNLPKGAQRWTGFNKFLEVMEATGKAPVKGSDTAFNTVGQKALGEAGGLVSRAFEQTSQAGLGVKRAISDRWLAYRMGQNTTELANLLTDPVAASTLAELARSPANSARAQTLTLRLLYMSDRAAAQPKTVD